MAPRKRWVETVEKTDTSRPWAAAFLARLRERPNVTAACSIAGVGRATAYRHRESDPAFAAEWDAAVDASVDELEEIARRRAAEGSDTLIIFLLKAHRPEKYRERYQMEHSGGINISISKVDADL